MRRTQISFSPSASAGIYSTVDFDALAGIWQPGGQYAVLVKDADEACRVDALRASGLELTWVQGPGLLIGDVLRLNSGQDRVDVLYRRSDRHHTLFLTNRCNSNCLMCSQPPTRHDDGWLVDEAIEIVTHIQDPPFVIGITGGEPTLLGSSLLRVVEAIRAHLPETRTDILTNGRLLGVGPASESLPVRLDPQNLTWLVPLYGHADFLHDYVVQSHGAFDETIAGLLALQHHGHSVQLRIVLIEPVLTYLSELCTFIGRNLPFVREVALMACEPIGFALANRDSCEVNLADWQPTLRAATRVLQRHRVPMVLMNAPLCVLPEDLRPYAERSISDWKNVYAPECDNCAAKDSCCGLFEWHTRGWKPGTLRPLRDKEVLS